MDILLLCAIIGGVYFLESGASRLTLENYLSRTLDRRVVIEENLDLRFYPWLGLKSGPVRVFSDKNGTSEQISVGEINMGVKLLPLLGGDLNFDTIELKNPVIHITRNSDGDFNFPTFSGNSTTERKTSDRQNAEHDGFFINSVSIPGITVDNATCVYKDSTHNTEFELSGIDIRTGPVGKHQPVAFDISADFQTVLFGINAQAHLKGLAAFSVDKKKIQFSDTSIYAEADSAVLFGRNNTLQATARLDFDPIEGSVDINGLVVRGNAVTLSGSGTGRSLYSQPVIEGTLKSTKFDPRIYFNRYFAHKIPEVDDSVLSSANLSCRFNVSKSGAQFNDINLSLDETHCSGHFYLKDFSNPWCEFNLEADYLKVDKYKPLFFAVSDSGSTKSEASIPADNKKIYNDSIAHYVRMIPCKGQLGIGHIIDGGFNLHKVAIKVSPGPVVLDVRVGSGKFYDGLFSMNSKLMMESEKSDQMILEGHGSISPFSLRSLNKDESEVKFLSGLGEAEKVSLTSNGKTISELSKNFRSSVKSVFKNVRILLSDELAPNDYKNISIKQAEVSSSINGLAKNKIKSGFRGKNLSVDFKLAGVEPHVDLSGFFKGDVYYAYRKNNFLMDFNDADFKVSASGKGIPVLKKPVSIQGLLGYSTENKKIKLRNTVLSSNGVSVGIDSVLSDFDNELKADGKFTIAKVSCSNIYELFEIDKPETQSDDAFDSVEVHSAFRLNGKALHLDIDHFTLDNSTAFGLVDFKDYTKPDFSFKLTADNVNVDRFMPPDEEPDTGSGEQNSTASEKIPEWNFPDKFLSSIRADGYVSCEAFSIFDISAEDITAHVSMKDALISISDIKSKFHEGDLGGKLSLALKKGVVGVALNLTGQKFQAGPFFKEFVGRDYVQGLTNAKIDITGRSSANRDFVDTLNGNLVFNIKDGAYKLKSADEKSENKIKSTKFSLARGTIEGVDEGRFSIRDFLLKTRFITATAKGGFNIPDDNISVRLKVDVLSIPDLYLKLLNTIVSAISGVDVDITGKLSKPHVEVKGLMRWDNVFEDILGLPGRSFNFLKDALF